MPSPLPRRLALAAALWLALPLGAAELLARWNPGDVFGVDRDSYGHLSEEDVHPIDFDPQLGWVPRPGSYPSVWPGADVTINASRLRSNGSHHPRSAGGPILAVGDSFTFGDQVSDHETWPAYLEQALDRRVLNGGVSSYGFDQTVLRAERLVDRFDPALVVVSLIDDDVPRASTSTRSGAGKPLFWWVDGELVLDPAPLVPWGEAARWRGLAHRSALLKRLLSPWLYAVQDAHEDEVAVCCALMDRLATLPAPLVILAQYERNLRREQLRPVLDCARRAGLPVVDTYDALAAAQERAPDEFDALFEVHMTPAGNKLVAAVVAEHLAQISSRLRPHERP